MKPEISILLPLYNAVGTLKECFDSLQQQTCSNFEVIVVDDASTDQSSDLLNEYAQQDARFNIVTHEKNCGIVQALNTGLKHCKGDWIARMDADDRMYPQRLQVQMDYCIAHPEVDILGTQVRVFRTDRELTPGQVRYQDWGNSLISADSIKEQIFVESPIMHPTFFLKADFYKKMGGYLEHPWPEDYDFLLRAFLKGARLEKVPQVLLEKRDSDTRIVRTDPRCSWKSMLHAKVFYFSRMLPTIGERKLILVGAGMAGKLALTRFQEIGISIEGFLDNFKSKEKNSVSGIPSYTLKENGATELLKGLKDCFFIFCIGNVEGRKAVETIFCQNGFKPVKDYIRFL